MVDLASLVVRLVADTSRYRRGIDQAGEDLRNFANNSKLSVGKVAAAATGAALAAASAFAVMAKAAIDTADNLNDLSKSTGISVESLSQLRYAAEQSGTDLDGLSIGLRKLSKQASEAASGSEAAAESFEQIGVSVTDSNGKLKGTEQLLLDVADKFSQYKDGAGKAAAAQALFGKSGAELIPFLNEGRGGIERLKEEAAKLGLTISGGTAQAADDFNDRLNKLQAKVTGAATEIVSKMLPGLLRLVERFTELVTEGDSVNSFLDNLGKIFKFVAAGAVRLYYFITNLGRQLGALGAAAVAAAKFQFTEAKAILDENLKDQVEAEKNMNKTLAAIYGERAEITTPKPSDRPKDADKPLKDFPQLPAKVKDELEEVKITLQKIEVPEDFYKDLHDDTKTELESVFEDYRSKLASLEVLKIEGQIDPLLFDARLKGIEEQFQKDMERFKEPVKKLNEYQVEAARNTQNIIADTFEQLATSGELSAKSILKSFGNMIVSLAAQAAAANIAGKLFGEAGGGDKGSSGWVGTALGALGGFFGGTRDSGGRGRPGMAYAIGTGAQPEMFIPDRSGTFVPAGAGGGLQVNNNFTVMADGPISKRTQIQIAAAAARGVERASRRNN